MSAEPRIVVQSPEELAAGARSAAYRLLAAAFDFPGAALAEAITSGQWVDEFAALSAHLPFDFQLAVGALSLKREEMEQEYIRLFEVGAGRPFCPLYEGSHRSGRMKIMEELVRFYEHFGLRPDAGDQPDHLCAELEFMHYLAFKEAATASDFTGPDLVLAQRDFLARHLCRWLPGLRRRLEGRDPPSPYYAALSRLADEFCRLDLGWLQQCRAKSDRQMGALPD